MSQSGTHKSRATSATARAQRPSRLQRLWLWAAALTLLATVGECRGKGPAPVEGSDGVLEDAREDRHPPDWDWVFVYYMSYDNDLSHHGPPILDMLAEGIRAGDAGDSDRVAAVVLADFDDADGLRRYELTAGGRREVAVGGEGSAETGTLTDFLAWVGDHYEARKYALIFLDHGGRLDQMSNDARPGRAGGANWLSVPEVATALSRWRSGLRGEVELLFLQQCGRGAVEDVYELRAAAPVLLASQARMDAPNSYYPDVLAWAGRHPEAGGEALAAQIAQQEGEDGFVILASVRTDALEELPRRLDAALAPALAVGAGLATPDTGVHVLRVAADGGDGDDASGPLELPFEVQQAGLHTVLAPAHLASGLQVLDASGQRIALGPTLSPPPGEVAQRQLYLEAGPHRLLVASPPAQAARLAVVPEHPLVPCYVPDDDDGERYFDLIDWLQAFYTANGLPQEPLDELAGWLRGEVVATRRVASASVPVAGHWSGLSVLIPDAAGVLARYEGYGLYRASRLDEFHRAWLAAGP
jgi:hypothetical protein